MRTVLIFFVRAYQVILSPLFTGCCRFEPSCSNYSIEALTRHGAVKGSILTVARLLRCRPFGPHGYDPVPEKITLQNLMNGFVGTRSGVRSGSPA